MLNPARANSCTVASCSDPLGSPSFSVAAMSLLQFPEARARARVADVAVTQTRDLQQHGVLVAVDEQGCDLQAVAGGLPFRPQRMPRAAEERGEARRARPCERFFVHESHHQHFVAGVVLNDRRYQSRKFRVVHIDVRGPMAYKTKAPPNPAG